MVEKKNPFREGPWSLQVETHPGKGVRIISDDPEDLSVGEIVALFGVASFLASKSGLDVQTLIDSKVLPQKVQIHSPEDN